jgi:hypothetical protein
VELGGAVSKGEGGKAVVGVRTNTLSVALGGEGKRRGGGGGHRGDGSAAAMGGEPAGWR